ncbi:MULTISPECIES: nuclear transport factor 2 family protein [unclassified Microbacterium]|uniref:YybH family protein n=1 Tax=unclassified Microbacterium TaxID=2609290 RepID=UPI000C2BC69E|nr:MULTISPECIES: nuclear transport factor 2 family protein [unclassified Microbacterium]
MTTAIFDLAELPRAFADRFNARDLDGLVALTTPETVFVPAPGQPVQGADQVRAALESFLGIDLPISLTVRHTFVAGATGLAVADWKIEGTGPDGAAVSLSGSTADVATLDEAKGWRYTIDNPFGTA